VRNCLLHFSVIGLAIGLSLGVAAQTAAPKPAKSVAAASAGDVTNPVADPKAVVTVGQARFTVLTPELIRMEWAADGKFEDHASFVFLNRRLAVPKFEQTLAGQKLTLKTSALTLTYAPTSDGRFTAGDRRPNSARPRY